MIKSFLLGTILLAVPNGIQDAGWSVFERVQFKTKYIERYGEHFLVPQFDAAIREREGKLFVVKGYYMPMDIGRQSIVISKYPYAACFFCGGAGPESVAEINFKIKPPRFKTDQIITIEGRLKLNDSDVTHLNFILEEAELVTASNSKN